MTALVAAIPLLGPPLSGLLSLLSALWLPLGVALFAVVVAEYIRQSFFDPKDKMFGVPVEVDGPGVAYRNARFLSFLDTPVDGALTIPALFDHMAQKFSDLPLLGTRQLLARELVADEALGRKFEKVVLGEFVWESFAAAHERAVRFGAGLVALGHGEGEKVAIFAETRADWFVSLQGAFQQGLVVVTVYASLGDEALIHCLNETEVTTVVCDSKQLAKILSSARQLASVQRVVVMPEQDEEATAGAQAGAPEGWTVVGMGEVEEKGGASDVAPNLPQPSDLAVIMYTSGSTGMPKGVMMRHQNLVATIAAVLSMLPPVGPQDSYFAYLPLAHVLELAAETGLPVLGIRIGYGAPLTMIDSGSKLKKGTRGDLPVLQPTLMAAVPAILDRIREGVRKKIESQSPTVQSLFNFAYQRRLAAVEGSWLGAWGVEQLLWDELVFKKVRAATGGNLRFMLSGGAPLSADTQRFINICFGIPVGQGYGLTETCAAATFCDWRDGTVGRVGAPVPCGIIKLTDWEDGGYLTSDSPLPRGEICIGGLSVTAGYFKNDEKTQEVYFEDKNGLRWFHTGDIGQFHPDGVLEIVDRKKDIVKLQAGEYVALGKVEAALQASPLVDNIMLHADPLKSFAIALVVPNHAKLQEVAAQKGVADADDVAALCKNPEVVVEVSKSLQQAGKEAKLQKFELPAKIQLLPEPWTPESGLVTAALKLKREVLKKYFADDLAELYA